MSSREAQRRLARAEAQQRRRAARRASHTEQRVVGVWLVQLAAHLRPLLGTRLSWRMLQWASRRVVIEQRDEGGEWYRLSMRVEISPQGDVRLVRAP